MTIAASRPIHVSVVDEPMQEDVAVFELSYAKTSKTLEDAAPLVQLVFLSTVQYRRGVQCIRLGLGSGIPVLVVVNSVGSRYDTGKVC